VVVRAAFDYSRGMHLAISRLVSMLIVALAAGCAGPGAGNTGAANTSPEPPAAPAADSAHASTAPSTTATVPAGWQPHTAPSAATLHHGFFLDHTRAWLVSHQGGQILRTIDGGATWQAAAELGDGFLEMIHFVDAARGFVAGDGGRVLATSDGGSTWRAAAPLSADIAFYGLVFFTPEHGFAGGVDTAQRRGRLFETRDSGQSWIDRSDDITGFGFTDAVVMPGPDQALVGGMGVVYRTEDGGARWQVIDIGARGGVRGLFAGRQQVWAVGAKGLVAQSSDIGRTWSLAAPFTDALLRSVVFVDAREGFAAGDVDGDGVSLWHTRDGGATWQPDARITVGIHRLIVGAGRLWAVGEDGALLSRGL
jgi:photosystem II stability/assembly factor-like uncharacterized protein